ncbi:MAG TPA: lipoprotein insertase outer membrane protein LolB [Azospira sp.]|nr:lipoprotein insertase outer membrane protein LolB [Azospira sp.]
MLRFLSRLLFLGLLALLAACATPSPRYAVPAVERQALRQFQIEGRFSLRQENNSYSGKLSWHHGPEGDDIFLMNPFGQGVAQINRRPGAARLLTADQKEYLAADADQLVADVLGYSLPVAGMAEWLLARASSGGTARRDAQGRLLQLQEAGWDIDYDYGDTPDPQALPLRLTARRGAELELKLRIDDWSAQ